MSMTNDILHTANMTNDAIMVQTANTTWDQANYTWDQAQGTWDAPYGIANDTLHTAAMTNDPVTP